VLRPDGRHRLMRCCPTPTEPGAFAVIKGVDNFAIAMAGALWLPTVQPDKPGLHREAICAFGRPLCLGGQKIYLKGFYGAAGWKSMAAQFGLMNAYAAFFIRLRVDRGPWP